MGQVEEEGPIFVLLDELHGSLRVSRGQVLLVFAGDLGVDDLRAFDQRQIHGRGQFRCIGVPRSIVLTERRLNGGAELLQVRTLGGHCDHASRTVLAEQCSLRATQCLDALDIVNMDIEVGADGGYRLLIEIQTHAGG